MGDLRNDASGVTWTVEPRGTISVEETGLVPENPPVLVAAGPKSTVSLAAPRRVAEWPACVVFLRQLRDGVDELAELLAIRAAVSAVPEGEADRD